MTLRFKQEEIIRRGYAIQFRINAEDPQNSFLPSFGKISRYYAPGGPGVRTDTAIYTGYDIPPFYDSMVAKVIVSAHTWDDAIKRGERALRDMGLFGIKTTIPYYLEILSHPEFSCRRVLIPALSKNIPNSSIIPINQGLKFWPVLSLRLSRHIPVCDPRKKPCKKFISLMLSCAMRINR